MSEPFSSRKTCALHERVDYPGCEHWAAVITFCTVEGRDYALCNPCSRAWKARCSGDAQMYARCPLCVHIYLGTLPPQTGPSQPMVHKSSLVGPLAEIIETAMYQEGLLVDVRSRVLARLGQDPRIAEYMGVPA